MMKNCSLSRQLLHSFSPKRRKSSTPLSCLFLLAIILPVLSFKPGHVEPVPGSRVLRNSRPLTGPSSNSQRNQFPPTGGGGSRSAILTKLTSPRREFGGHVYEDPNALGSISSPIASDLYAFSKSTESQQITQDTKPHAPFVRFPTISSPFNSIGSRIVHSRETYHHRPPPPPQPSPPPLPNPKKNPNTKVLERPHQQQQTPFAQSVSDLLAQHEEPSSLFGTAHEDLEDELLLDSYYTTGSEDPAAHHLSSSQFDNDRYGSQEEDDLFEKQSATPTTTVVNASSSTTSSSATTTNKSTSSNDSNSNNNNNNNNHSNNSSSSLSKPTLLPLPANYLSLATFRQIDNTLEKSSSNILSRIANFWRNRTMSSSSNRSSSSNSTVTANNNNNNNNNHSQNFNPDAIATNTYTKLGSDSSSSVDTDHQQTNDNKDVETDHDFVNNVNHDRVNNQRSKKNSNNHNNHRSNNSSVPLSKYVSIEDLDAGGVSIGGGAGTTANSNQYLSLDDEDDGEGVVLGEDDFAVSTSGGKTQEDERTPPPPPPTKTQAVVEEADGSNQLKDHFRRHHDHHSTSVEDYITSETTSSAQAAELEEWLVGGDDSREGSQNTFHNDLFHTTTGTITAVIDNNKSSNKKDLVSSGSSKIERVQKSDSVAVGEDKKRQSSTSTVTGGSSSGVGISSKGNVKRAESDKIWSSIDSHFGRHDLIESAESEEEHDYYIGMTIGGFLKRELWTIPLFVLASLNMILIILFEVYVLCRARGTSRRHLFLGQMLLFGLFLCSFLALMFAVHPSIIGCFVGRLGVGITYSLIFSVLMVKCVFLLSLDTGVYLPTSYQGILLFFAVAVQVAVDTQWVIMYPPFLQTVESGRSILLQCGTSFVQLLYSLSYVGFLILVVGFLAGRAAYKGVVENYKEAVYILITAVVTVPVALSWTVAGWMLQGRHQDACVSFGLVAHSLTTFLIMFMPKVVTKDLSVEDNWPHWTRKRCALKIKRINAPDGNLYTTLEPTVSTINPNVFFHRNDFHSGMIY